MTRPVPPLLWVSLIALGVGTLIQLLIGVTSLRGPLLIGVLLNIILGVGLYRGARWAFVLTLVFGVAGVLVTLAKSPAVGLGVLVANAIVLVPMVLAREYFFGPRFALPRAAAYCPRCGRPLTDPRTPNCPVCNPA